MTAEAKFLIGAGVITLSFGLYALYLVSAFRLNAVAQGTVVLSVVVRRIYGVPKEKREETEIYRNNEAGAWAKNPEELSRRCRALDGRQFMYCVYNTRVRYEFLANGERFTGSTTSPYLGEKLSEPFSAAIQGNGLRNAIMEVMKFPEGASIPVWYRRQSPEINSLSIALPLWARLLLLFGAMLIAFGAAWHFLAAR